MEVFRDLSSEEKVETGDGRDEKNVLIYFLNENSNFLWMKTLENRSYVTSFMYGLHDCSGYVMFGTYSKIRWKQWIPSQRFWSVLTSCKCSQNNRTALFQKYSRLAFLTKVLDSITFGDFKMKLAVWPLKRSGVLLKQHCQYVQLVKSGSDSTLWLTTKMTPTDLILRGKKFFKAAVKYL